MGRGAEYERGALLRWGQSDRESAAGGRRLQRHRRHERGGEESHPKSVRNGDAYGHANGYANAYGYTNGNANAYSHTHIHAYAYSHVHAYGDSHIHAYSYVHAYGHSDSYSDA